MSDAPPFCGEDFQLSCSRAANFIWCVILNIRNRTGYEYFDSEIRGGVPGRNKNRYEEHIIETVTDAPAEEMAVALAVPQETGVRAPMPAN